MYDSDSPGKKRSDAIGTCPCCGAAYHDVVDVGPDDLQLVPCGHRVRSDGLNDDRRATVTPHADGGILIADGGRRIDWADLRAFQRDLLLVTEHIAARGGVLKGLAIKAELEELYGQEIGHGRIYPNLDELAEMGLIDIGQIDRRTNRYELTADGKRVVAEMAAYAAEVAEPVSEVAAVDGGDVDG